MEEDWTYQWQHDSTREIKVEPKFSIGETVLYDGEKVKVKNVRNKTSNTFTYDLEEYPHSFVFEFELEKL